MNSLDASILTVSARFAIILSVADSQTWSNSPASFQNGIAFRDDEVPEIFGGYMKTFLANIQRFSLITAYEKWTLCHKFEDFE